MNKLPIQKRVQILNLLVEGMSLRATSRIADVSINTVTKLLIDAGKACMDFHDATVHHVKAQYVQCDEIWSFVYKKEKNVPESQKGKGTGDAWTWIAIDAETKLVISWYVGSRNATSAYIFIKDVRSRLRNRVQLTTDGLHAYLEAVRDTFGSRIDFAQLIKIYGNSEDREKLYGTVSKEDHRKQYIGAKKTRILCNPDLNKVTTSHIERQNLTMRMHMRRFTRETNAFSKKLENHCYAIALHFAYYNFVKIHSTLRVTPAMEAGLIKELMSIEDIVNLIGK